MTEEPYLGVSPPRFSLPSGRPIYLFAKSRSGLPIRVFSGEDGNYRLDDSVSLKVLSTKCLGDPPPSLCLGINPRFSALIAGENKPLAKEAKEEALKVPSWQIAPPVYQERWRQHPASSPGCCVDWIICRHSENDRKSHTWQTVGKNQKLSYMKL